MAAGIGSRYGGGIKQLAPVGPNGEIIMDYSVHDAIAAGFSRIVFIIRRDIEEDFRRIIGDRIEAVCAAHGVSVGYAFQDLHDIPGTFPEGRTKPWGTGQAVLAAKDLIDGAFCVINADDYYGQSAFRLIQNALAQGGEEFCMAGFILRNTLSDNGGVTRGICAVSENGSLQNITETHNIVKTPEGASADGKPLDLSSIVSMNMWGFTQAFLPVLEQGFRDFFANMSGDPLKAEFLIPTFIGKLLEQNRVKVKVLETTDNWFGVTYQEDRESVAESFKQLIAGGVYRSDLFSDL